MALCVAIVMTAVVGATLLYQRQPDLTALTDYRPKQPLRIYTEDGAEIGQFGSERRYLVPISPRTWMPTASTTRASPSAASTARRCSPSSPR